LVVQSETVRSLWIGDWLLRDMDGMVPTFLRKAADIHRAKDVSKTWGKSGAELAIQSQREYNAAAM